MEHNLYKSEIEVRIYLHNGQQIVLASDLAELYGVQTKVINQSVKRNLDCFPELFAFKITNAELNALRSQNVTLGFQHIVRSASGIRNSPTEAGG